MDKIVGVHLDLKYEMPAKSYLLEWLRRLPSFGVNTLLLEYEDKFPYRRYPFLRDAEAFSEDELADFLGTAREVGLRIIPLVQSCSHLEFALAHESLRDLREAPDIHTQICPQNPQALAFVDELMDEVLAAHADDDWFHIGGDEAWHLGHCPRCAAWVAEKGEVGAWAEHTRRIAERVLAAGKTPIVWDDIFWKHPEDVRTAGLPRETILMSWNYGLTPASMAAKRLASPETPPLRCVDVYQEAGYRVLAAPCCNWGVLVPRRGHTLANTQVWADKVRSADMAGLVNTAWSCFHLALPTWHMQVAATGAICRGEQVDDHWQEQFWASEFGVPLPGIGEALETLGELWEIGVGLDRPLTMVPFGCMDMVLHFGSQVERGKAGAYPLDWADIDVAELYRRKLAILREADDLPAIIAKAEELRARYVSALDQLAPLRRATRHAADARLWLALATFKLVSLRVLLHHLQTPDASIAADFAAAAGDLAAQLPSAWEPQTVRKLLRLWAEPLRVSLAV